MRWVLRILGGLLVLLLLLVGGLALYLNEIASRAIEEGGFRALGVRTEVSGVLLRPISGKARVFGLQIDNPKGFDSPHFLTLADGFVDLDAGSIRSDPIEIRQIRLRQVELDLEKRGGRLNTDAILEHMHDSAADAEPEPAAEESSGPSVVVRELLIEDVTVYVDLVESMGKYGRMEVKIPGIRLANIGASDEGGAELSKLANVIVSALLSAVAKQSGGLPLEFTKDLVADLGHLGNVRYEVVGDVTGYAVDASGEVLDATVKSLGDVASGASDDAAESVKRAGEAVGRFFGDDE